jgi:hypothetical protein
MKCRQNEGSAFQQPSSRLISDGRRVPVFPPVPTDLGAGAMLASPLHHPDVLAISSAGSPCRSDLYCNFHGQMIRRGPEPCALQGDRLARVMRHRDADEVLISHEASRRVEVDPARTGNVRGDYRGLRTGFAPLGRNSVPKQKSVA